MLRFFIANRSKIVVLVCLIVLLSIISYAESASLSFRNNFNSDNEFSSSSDGVSNYEDRTYVDKEDALEENMLRDLLQFRFIGKAGSPEVTR